MWRSQSEQNSHVVIKVMKAELRQSHITVGWMSPYARVEWSGTDGVRMEVSRTSKHRRGHKNPVWEHTCEGVPYGGPSHGDQLRFQVLQDHFDGRRNVPKIAGEAIILIDELLEGSQKGGYLEPKMGLRKDLPLRVPIDGLKVEALLTDRIPADVGTITVQALLVPNSTEGATPSRRARALQDLLGTVPEADASAFFRSSKATVCSAGGSVTVTPCDSSQKSSLRPDGSSWGTDVDTGFTICDPELFETPVSRLGVSGGTATFFRLLLREAETVTQTDAEVCSRDRWIGKDFLRAADEVTFYEQILELLEQGNRMGGLLDFTLEYLGIAFLEEEGALRNAPPRKLLVLQNMRESCVNLRMLDVKIGERTAAAGWHGKSRLGALKNSLLDGLTNSAAEGFRLEGFDGLPPALLSMDPLLDIGGSTDSGMTEKARRIMLQRMSASEMFMHFTDVHQKPEDPGDVALNSVISPLELAELVLNEAVRKLTSLAMACRLAPAPQKWIGSSVMIGFDQGALPARQTPEQKIRQKVQVHTFDWGRSELTTLERHLQLSPAEQNDRGKFWRFYCRGIDRLAWEAARAYSHRFGNDRDWQTAVATVFDFDSMSANDFLGRATLCLLPTEGLRTLPLLDMKGRPVNGPTGPATLTYAISFRFFPKTSRLRGAWRIHIICANDLPVANVVGGRSDPFVSLSAVSEGSKHYFTQTTSVVPRTLHPCWNETLDLPLVHPPATSESRCLLSAILGEVRPMLGTQPLRPMLPAENADSAKAEAALTAWTEHLDDANAAAAPNLLLAFAETRLRRARSTENGT